jgi:hypothetical protein
MMVIPHREHTYVPPHPHTRKASHFYMQTIFVAQWWNIICALRLWGLLYSTRMCTKMKRQPRWRLDIGQNTITAPNEYSSPAECHLKVTNMAFSSPEANHASSLSLDTRQETLCCLIQIITSWSATRTKHFPCPGTPRLILCTVLFVNPFSGKMYGESSGGSCGVSLYELCLNKKFWKEVTSAFHQMPHPACSVVNCEWVMMV